MAKSKFGPFAAPCAGKCGRILPSVYGPTFCVKCVDEARQRFADLMRSYNSNTIANVLGDKKITLRIRHSK